MAKNKNNTQINTNISKQRQQSIKYWQDRAIKNYTSGEKDALQVAKQLKSNYERSIREINNKINQFYGKYASENKMTLEEAKQYLSKPELKDFRANIKDILKMGKKENLTDAQLHEFKRLYTKTKISRLDELQANIKYELDKLTNSTKDEIENLLSDTYEDTYYKTVYDTDKFKGFTESFSGINEKSIQRAVNEKYLGDNYSTRLYKNETNLINTLSKEIPRGLTLGYNPRKLADMVDTKLGTNYNNAVRLIRTEYGKILNESTLAGYKASGIQSYQIMSALDSRTCDDCGSLDDTIIPIKDGEVGVNLPPFHPNCRCTTVPYFNEDELLDIEDTVINTKSQQEIPITTTYQQWKDNLYKYGGKLKYREGGE